VIVSSTDGVGTKTAIAAAVGRFDTIGIDLVAMCADDVVCTGAEPLAFLDYVAVGRLDPIGVAELVAGIADGCRQAGCALVGGETAEHPGLMEPGEFDLAGFCIGVGERDRLLDGTAARAGDAIVGLASSGLHANGYSLVRALVAEHGLDLATPYQALLRRVLGDAATDELLAAEPHHALATLGEVLLTPTRIYARDLLAIREVLVARGHDVRGMAHVTGGGLPGNVPRALPDGLGARLDVRAWPMPSVMRLFGGLGAILDDELRATFNGGLGMVIVVPAAAARDTVELALRRGTAAWVVGEVVEAAALGGARYAEEGWTR
jgi:phosphoribosylformylglycinamidine cyclo-ligase